MKPGNLVALLGVSLINAWASAHADDTLADSDVSTNAVIAGTTRPDNLIGTPGDDTLNGYGGADVMTGLAGNDIYIVDDFDDAVVEGPGEGVDRVRSSADAFELPEYV